MVTARDFVAPQGTFWVEALEGRNILVAAVGYLNSAPNIQTYIFETALIFFVFVICSFNTVN
jgi:hypothetical protein